MRYDVAVVGAGVVGALTARELTKYRLRVALIERYNDVAMGATKANSAIVHGGFDAVPGTLKAKLNVRGAALMPGLCKRLGVPYENNGSLVLAFSEEEMTNLGVLMDRGRQNGVSGLEIIGPDKIRGLEPNVGGEAVGALLCTSSGIVCPYELTVAAAENAVTNGAEFIRSCEVKAISYADGAFTLHTEAGETEASYIINAAGTHSGELAEMIGDGSIRIIPRKGEYYLLDKAFGGLVSHTIFQCPTRLGKGVLVTPTVDGNLLIGPSASDEEDRDDTDTTQEGLSFILQRALKSVPSLNIKGAITSFAGVRAHPAGDDFIIGFSEKNDRFLNLAGIESPGLSAAPAIAEYAAGLFCEKAAPKLRTDFDGRRPAPVRFRNLSKAEREALVAKDRRYGRVICRCETITEGEILDAIHAPAGARDIDGVKRRTRAGMGRCQGGFCGPKVAEILARELGIPLNGITKFGGGSKILFDRTK